MKKIKFFIYLSVVLATILGVYAQDISYYISSNFEKIYPLYCLTVLTLISITLFLLTPILILIFIKKNKIEKKEFATYLIINSLIGIPISIYSLFVLGMWLS